MDDPDNTPAPGGALPAAQPVAPTQAPLYAPSQRWFWIALAALGALCVASLVFAWKAEQRGATLEQELVRRQQTSAGDATAARALAKQSQEMAGETAAKVALLEARVAEVAVQRTQLEDLIQSLSRSRDENVLVDIDSAIRVALQQTAITGSAEPLVATLKQSDERLARYNQPRLEGVRRAITRDLDRVKATSVADIASLGIKLDEAIRLIDELPLFAVADLRGGREAGRQAPSGKANVAVPLPASAPAGRGGQWLREWNRFGEKVWSEAKSLVRVTRIDHPEAMLLAPEQSFFIRENLKLRLLNARLALLSRQFDTAQADLQAAQTALDRYFDRTSKRTVLATELIRQVGGQARQIVVPRPDDTLAALTAASAGR
ncbi:MAG: uroporphyrinogen-III C-methyltransferase [Rhizobiales bacterium]|nr:uroporphyrinogen-III C-methyltransferase [Rhizobacter sp.]